VATKTIRNFFILLFLAVVFFSFATDFPKLQQGGFFSDGASYFAIIQSLAWDGDLVYTRDDIVRIRQRFDMGPTGLFLKKGKDGRLYFAKSFIYPLAAAPFFRLFDVSGVFFFNGLMLFFAVLLSYLLLKRYHPPGRSLAFALIFLFTSVTWVYIWWMQADLFNFFVMFAGLFFFFYPFRRGWPFFLCAPFFFAAVLSKPTNAVPVGIVLLLLLYRKEWKKTLVLGLVFLGLFAALGFFFIQTGNDLNFMGGERRTFYGDYPYEKPGASFASGFKMTADDYWQRLYLTPVIAALNLFYYFFGRFTGIFIYFFPACFILLLFCFQKKLAEDWFLLAAIAASVLIFILVFDPENYFGGGGSLGNRYFLNIFPLFFFLGHRHRLFRFRWLPVLAAVLFLTPIFANSYHHSTNPAEAGKLFPLKYFPAEKTQYKCLPSNLNPRAFGPLFHSEESRYWLFILNDNFNPLAEPFIWTYGDRQLEFFLVSPSQVREFRIELGNHPLQNQIHFRIDGKKKNVALAPMESRVITFSRIPGFRVDRGYLYQFFIKADQGYSQYLVDQENDDFQLLGVKVRIVLIH